MHPLPLEHICRWSAAWPSTLKNNAPAPPNVITRASVLNDAMPVCNGKNSRNRPNVKPEPNAPLNLKCSNARPGAGCAGTRARTKSRDRRCRTEKSQDRCGDEPCAIAQIAESLRSSADLRTAVAIDRAAAAIRSGGTGFGETGKQRTRQPAAASAGERRGPETGKNSIGHAPRRTEKSPDRRSADRSRSPRWNRRYATPSRPCTPPKRPAISLCLTWCASKNARSTANFAS